MSRSLSEAEKLALLQEGADAESREAIQEIARNYDHAPKAETSSLRVILIGLAVYLVFLGTVWMLPVERLAPTPIGRKVEQIFFRQTSPHEYQANIYLFTRFNSDPDQDQSLILYEWDSENMKIVKDWALNLRDLDNYFRFAILKNPEGNPMKKRYWIVLP